MNESPAPIEHVTKAAVSLQPQTALQRLLAKNKARRARKHPPAPSAPEAPAPAQNAPEEPKPKQQKPSGKAAMLMLLALASGKYGEGSLAGVGPLLDIGELADKVLRPKPGRKRRKK